MNAETGKYHERDYAPADADADEIAGYVDANRAALDQTLSQLENSISPQAMFDMALDRLRNGGGMEYMHRLRDSVVRNPLPVAMTAVGVAWTAYAERYPASPASSSRGNGHGRMQQAQDGLKNVKDSISSGASEVRARGQGWLDRGRSGAHSARARASEWSSSAAERSRESAARAEQFSREHPLVLAGAGLTIGAVLAALLPSTEMEDEYLGPVRDEAFQRASDTASEMAGDVESDLDEIVQTVEEKQSDGQ